MLKAVTMREIEKIFAVTDRIGVHREQLVIPLATRHPGRVRKLPNGKLEIIVDSEGNFDDWVSRLEAEIRGATEQGAAPEPPDERRRLK